MTRRAAPTLTGATGGGTGSNIEGSLTSVANTTFLIQFFSSLVADPSGFGQGQTFLGSTTVTTHASGIASIDFNLLSGLAVGTWVTATATNESHRRHLGVFQRHLRAGGQRRLLIRQLYRRIDGRDGGRSTSSARAT